MGLSCMQRAAAEENASSATAVSERLLDSDGSVQKLKLKNDALMTGFLGLDFGKKDSPKERIQTVVTSKTSGTDKASSRDKGGTVCTERPLEEIIASAAEYAVRQEEEYMMTSIKACLEEYREQKEEEKKAKDIWMKVSIAEGCCILTMLAAGITAVNLSKRK